MKKFAGFPERMAFTAVPNLFFSGLLPAIDDLAELKVTIHLLRVLQEKRAFPRLVGWSELMRDRTLLAGLQATGLRAPEILLEDGLRRACARGTLLEVMISRGGEQERVYLLNTTANRDLALRAERGEISLGQGKAVGVDWVVLPAQRPGIYDLYEQNIGLITPLIAEELREAEQAYPAAWIEDAFREAVGYNRRNWRYVRRILENWAIEGRSGDGKDRRRAKGAESASKYVTGKYAGILKR